MRAAELVCGCCGCGFRTWPRYVDQDQDKGFGICRGCQAAAIRRNRATERRSFELLRGALNPGNQAKFDDFPLWKKRWLIHEAFEAGHLTWSIQR